MYFFLSCLYSVSRNYLIFYRLSPCIWTVPSYMAEQETANFLLHFFATYFASTSWLKGSYWSCWVLRLWWWNFSCLCFWLRWQRTFLWRVSFCFIFLFFLLRSWRHWWWLRVVQSFLVWSRGDTCWLWWVLVCRERLHIGVLICRICRVRRWGCRLSEWMVTWTVGYFFGRDGFEEGLFFLFGFFDFFGGDGLWFVFVGAAFSFFVVLLLFAHITFINND